MCFLIVAYEPRNEQWLASTIERYAGPAVSGNLSFCQQLTMQRAQGGLDR
jgi:hypothetical protein